jgi:hypothetical protein
MMLMKATYAITYKSVCDMTAFEDTPHHRALAITKTTELCRKYGLGTCPYADADCRNIHRGKSGSMLKLTDATPPTTPPSTWPSTKQKPYPNHISQRHRAAIGPMMGKVSPTNPMGISRNQVKKVYALQRSEGANTDSWLTGSIAHANGSNVVTNYPRLLMLRKTSSSSSSSAAAVAQTPPEDISDSSDTESVNYDTVQFTPPASAGPRFSFIMQSPILNVGILCESYINVLNPTVFSDRLDWTLHVARSAERTDKPTAVPIVAIFNWHYRGPSRQMSFARTDIATGDSALMHCLYQIGQTNYDAKVTIPTYRGYWEPNQFMTFSPSGPPYIPEDYPGSYISRTPNLSAFADYIEAIDNMRSGFLNTDMIQILYLSVVFDFMAFTAQTFRRVLKGKQSTPENLKAIRDIMVENISTMKAHHDCDTFSVMADILKAVVPDSEPVPSGHRTRYHNDPLFSPPPTRDDITPSKYARYEPNADTAISPVASIPHDSSTSASPDDEESPVSATDSPTPTVTFAPPGHYAKLVVVQSETMLRMSSAPTTVFDSGCSISGTSVLANLSNVTDCGPMSVQGAFGPAAQPTKRGLLTPLGLDAILLPGMDNQTLVSLSQFCDGGTSGQRNIGVFTNEGCRMFTLTSALPALQLLGESGHEVARGIVQDGIYVQESA